LKRDTAKSQNEIAFQLLNNDTRHQEEIAHLMSEFEAEKSTLIYNVLNIFNAVPLIDTNNIEQETFF
jgi:hypothetical protein